MFENKINYLALLNGAIITDLLFIVLAVFGIIQSNSLKEWYNNYSVGAAIADVSSIMIGIVIAYYVYPFIFKEFNLLKFIGCALVVQLCHDLLFGTIMRNIPEGSSRMIDTFKKYIGEHGFKILGVDATMILLTILISYYLSSQSNDINSIVLIVSLYFFPYFLYTI